MNALASDVMGAPLSLHRAEDELPFVPYQEGVVFQLLQVNIEGGLWVIRVRFEPGVTIQRHRHTGEVFAFTVSGSWRYLEYPDINTAGSYCMSRPAQFTPCMCLRRTRKSRMCCLQYAAPT